MTSRLDVRPAQVNRTLQEWHALALTFLSSDLKCSPVASSPTRASDSVRVATWLPSGPPEEGGRPLEVLPGRGAGGHRARRDR